jgi:hypothetical protein
MKEGKENTEGTLLVKKLGQDAALGLLIGE